MPTRFKLALMLGIVFFAAPVVTLACCPSDGNGVARSATMGLGESFPIAADLATDANYSVYEFERDGIRYVQINDAAGTVRAAVGRISSTFWVLPIGVDAERVYVPGNGTSIPPYTSARSIYRTSALEVWVYQTISGEWWAVRPASKR